MKYPFLLLGGEKGSRRINMDPIVIIVTLIVLSVIHGVWATY